MSISRRREMNKISLLRPRAFPNQTIVLEPRAGQGIPDPDRGGARDAVYSSCFLFLVSLVIDLCSLTAVEES